MRIDTGLFKPKALQAYNDAVERLEKREEERDAYQTKLLENRETAVPGDWDILTAMNMLIANLEGVISAIIANPDNWNDCPFRDGLVQADQGLKIHEDIGELYA